MLINLLPRAVRDSRERNYEIRTLARVADATLDPSNLRTKAPDVTEFGHEWPDVVSTMRWPWKTPKAESISAIAG